MARCATPLSTLTVEARDAGRPVALAGPWLRPRSWRPRVHAVTISLSRAQHRVGAEDPRRRRSPWTLPWATSRGSWASAAEACTSDALEPGRPRSCSRVGTRTPSSSYSYAEADLAAVTRTCVYDRANLGSSNADPGPRGLAELVADFEGVLQAADVPGPYVAFGHLRRGLHLGGLRRRTSPGQVAGIVFVEVPAPFRNPPAQIVADTRWDSPVNIENRDYLEVVKDAWAARTRIGDIPVTVMSNEYSARSYGSCRVPIGASGDAHQRQRPAWLAGAQAQCTSKSSFTLVTPSRSATWPGPRLDP